MKHGRNLPKLGRKAVHRNAMLANMAASLIMHHRIVTTQQKARALAPFMDRLIQTAKNGKKSLSARRLVAGQLYSPEAVEKLFSDTAPKMSDREGGYTQIYRLGRRAGDGAQTALVTIGLAQLKSDKKEKKEGKKQKGERPAGYDRTRDLEIFQEKAAAKVKTAEEPAEEAKAS
ncbi:MAG TPA: 50S ribosomal protein L17 [candidate division Zixibacteria bacterium]|nr:50S ribosomal protein L17 [candidate division Zixibacteria bacterium]